MVSVRRMKQAFGEARYQDVVDLEVSAPDYDAESRMYAAAAFHRIGQLGNALGFAQDALKCMVREGAADQFRMDMLATVAPIWTDAGMPERAIEMLTEALQIAEAQGVKHTPLAHYRLGLALRAVGRYAEAVAAYRAAVKGFYATDRANMACEALQNAAWAACLGGDAETALALLVESDPLCGSDESIMHQELGQTFVTLLVGTQTERDVALATIESASIHRGNDVAVRAQAAWLAAKLYAARPELDADIVQRCREYAVALAVESGCPRLIRDAEAL